MGFHVELREPVALMLREKFKWIHKNESTKARHRDGQARKSYEVIVMMMEQRGLAIQSEQLSNFSKGGINGTDKTI